MMLVWFVIVLISAPFDVVEGDRRGDRVRCLRTPPPPPAQLSPRARARAQHTSCDCACAVPGCGDSQSSSINIPLHIINGHGAMPSMAIGQTRIWVISGQLGPRNRKIIPTNSPKTHFQFAESSFSKTWESSNDTTRCHYSKIDYRAAYTPHIELQSSWHSASCRCPWRHRENVIQDWVHVVVNDCVGLHI